MNTCKKPGNYLLLNITTALLVVLFILSSFESPKINEIIRREVENLSEYKTLSGGYQVFCIPSVREVYLHNEFNPFWTSEKAINDLVSIIERCGDEGLHPEDYHLSEIREIQKSKNEQSMATLDIILSDAFLLYASHILSGKVNPETIDPEWHVVNTDKNPLKYLYDVPSGDVQKILRNLLPDNKNYIHLQEKLKYYRSLVETTSWEMIPTGGFLKPGMSSERIPAIRKRLIFFGDLEDDSAQYSTRYDDTLKIAMVHFQKRHGLEALGNIGNQTIEMLNLSPAERIRILTVNLERLRWLPQEIPNYYLTVNIVSFELDVVLNNQVVRNHKVIVGKDYRKTPVFSSTMQYLVFNPTWTIPPTILKNDVIPAVRKDTSYLASKKISVYNSKGEKLNADSINWKSNKTLSYTFRQEPGPNNALGAVKFMFPNKFSIYFHDTPSRELFKRTERAFSSGCIRVQNPLELAEYLLKDQPGYTLKDIKEIVKTNVPTTVRLKNKPEVFLVYLTSWVDDDGILQYRKDIYQRDQGIYNALQKKPQYNFH